MAISFRSMQRGCVTAALLAATGTGFAAEPPVTDVAPIGAVRLAFDCQARALPTQREVGEVLGLYNFSQVYDARARLMSEVGRACQRVGIERVEVVVLPAAPSRHDAHYLARLDTPIR
ncbi:hypothetical protein [Aerolutibacter ruishenii]|uniref:Uncharacterized protein n=1 Tax=Aerolutibacter ruishenii TaxID=686800 RepID=A0A562M0E3_9GAMM|nr:hypothetical protein [Lysobacter ruishenii]TWI13417.1 hypothetical protein IP93_00579 [Lysobacter ruishenii]